MKLNSEQRQFLTYLKVNHLSLGYPYTIRMTLKHGTYDITDQRILEAIVRKFHELVAGDISHLKSFGKPTEYLQ